MAPGQLPAWRLSVPGIAAHRGGRQEAPENTLYGMYKGLAAGATHLEIDIRGTADDIPVVIHDETVDRTCLTSGEVASMTAAEVRSLDPCALWSELAGVATGDREPPDGLPTSWFRVPTLDEVLRTFPGVPTILDLKNTAPVSSVANVIASWNRTDDLILAGYDDEILEAASEALPGVPRGAGYGGTMRFFEGHEVEAEAIIVPLEHDGITLVDQGYVEQAHDEGKAFWVWTINEMDQASDLLGMGVDGLITDVPTKMSRLRIKRLEGP